MRQLIKNLAPVFLILLSMQTAKSRTTLASKPVVEAGFIAISTQATNLLFSNICSGTITVSCTSGNGNGRLIKINTANTFTDPVNGLLPMANSTWTIGEQVIYVGSGNSVTVTGLNASQAYYFRVYEYSGTGSVIFNINPALNNPLDQFTSNINMPVITSLFFP
jgi:hypothetical protein